MKYHISLLICLILCLTSCDDHDRNEPEILDYPCPEMKIGDLCVIDDDLSIRFLDVFEDSRCPSDVICVWPGQAGIELEYIFQDDLIFTDSLFAMAGTPALAESQFNKYHIRLKEVNPYPVSTHDILPEEYRISLDVTDDWFDATITGFDMRLCPAPCCGGLLIEIDGQTFVNYNYEEVSGVVLNDPEFPIPIRIRYTFDSQWPCMLIITEVE